jgi:hypothetical protein
MFYMLNSKPFIRVCFYKFYNVRIKRIVTTRLKKRVLLGSTVLLGTVSRKCNLKTGICVNIVVLFLVFSSNHESPAYIFTLLLSFKLALSQSVI